MSTMGHTINNWSLWKQVYLVYGINMVDVGVIHKPDDWRINSSP